MSRPHPRPLLPASPPPPSSSEDADSSSILSGPTKLGPARVLVAAACKECRIKKAKCNAQRPTCARCTSRGIECTYETKAGESRSGALKRKYSILEEENDQFRELWSLMQSKSREEAYEIFERIRTGGDPVEVLRAVKEAELLLPGHTSEHYRQNIRVEKLDVEAFSSSSSASPNNAAVQPWKGPSGDGFVSEVITQSYSCERRYYYPTGDRDGNFKT